jgi:hypothetical protein
VDVVDTGLMASVCVPIVIFHHFSGQRRTLNYIKIDKMRRRDGRELMMNGIDNVKSSVINGTLWHIILYVSLNVYRIMRVLLNAIHVKVLVILIASVAVTIVIVNGVVVDVWMMMKTAIMVMMVMRVRIVIVDIEDVMQRVAHSHVVVLTSVVDGVNVIIMLSKLARGVK